MAAQHVWEWYLDLHARRQIGFAPCPIAWSDLESWCRLRGVRPLEWELAAIFSLDDTFLKAAGESGPETEDGAPLVEATARNLKAQFSQFKNVPTVPKKKA